MFFQAPILITLFLEFYIYFWSSPGFYIGSMIKTHTEKKQTITDMWLGFTDHYSPSGRKLGLQLLTGTTTIKIYNELRGTMISRKTSKRCRWRKKNLAIFKMHKKNLNIMSKI